MASNDNFSAQLAELSRLATSPAVTDAELRSATLAVAKAVLAQQRALKAEIERGIKKLEADIAGMERLLYAEPAQLQPAPTGPYRYS